MTKRPAGDRADEIAREIVLAHWLTPDDQRAAREQIAAALRLYAAERLIEIIEEDDAARREAGHAD